MSDAPPSEPGGPTLAAPGHDGCAPERAAVRAGCDDAARTQLAHEGAVEALREARRSLAAVRHAEEAARIVADPRHRGEEKARAREQYEQGRALATDDAERAAALATWVRALDTINRAALRASRSLGAARAQTEGQQRELGDAERAEQAARIAAESAKEACLQARVLLARCEEEMEAAARMSADHPVEAAQSVLVAAGDGLRPETGGSRRAPTASDTTGRAGPVAPPAPRPKPEPMPRGAAAPAIGQDEPLVVERLLAGDRTAFAMVAERIAEQTGHQPAHELLGIQELVHAIVAAAGRRGYLVFDKRHPLWSQLDENEARDVVGALARLGFQLEPAEGWRGGRAPTSRDLSIALGYAGVEARSLRQHPTDAELRVLPSSIGVDARALLAAEAPDLALERVVRMLEERADRLGALWDDWGQVRPILLSGVHVLQSQG